MNTYTEKIYQTDEGLEVIHMIDGRPDQCSDCWETCQGCPDKPRINAATAAEEQDATIFDRINWDI
jgi:hypothetical protein